MTKGRWVTAPSYKQGYQITVAVAKPSFSPFLISRESYLQIGYVEWHFTEIHWASPAIMWWHNLAFAKTPPWCCIRLFVVKLQYYNAKSLQNKKDKNKREQEREGVGRVMELNESEYDFERMWLASLQSPNEILWRSKGFSAGVWRAVCNP